MGGNWMTDTTLPANDPLMRYLTIGSYNDAHDKEYSYPLEFDGLDSNSLGRAVRGVIHEDTTPSYTWKHDEDVNDHGLNDFSLIQATIRAYGGLPNKKALFGHDYDLGAKYIQGPFAVAASDLNDGWRAIGKDGVVAAAAQGSNPEGVVKDDWNGVFHSVLAMRPRTSTLLASEAFYKFELDASKVGSGGVYEAFMDAANQAVVDQFSLIYTGQSTPFEAAWTKITNPPTANDQYTEYAPNLIAPTSSSIASLQDIDEPTGVTPGSAPTITDPTQVLVEDNIDDAVAAFTAQAELRYAADEAKLRATFFGGRAVMSTFFDVALAQLTAHKNAQIAEYDKSLRVEQTRQQMQADITHQSNLLQKNTTQGQIDAEHVKLKVDTSFKNVDQVMAAQSKNREFEVEFQKINLQGYLGYLDALSKHNSLAAEVARLAQEFVFKKRDENYQYWATEVKQKIEVLACLYQSFVAFAGGSNSAAAVLAQLLQIDFKESVYRRDQELNWKQFNMQTANQMSNALHAFTEYKWKSQIQDLMVIKEALSAITSINSGTEHQPSRFEAVAQGVSGALGAVSSIANLGMILGG